jgi:hypothetical protein
MCVNDLFDLTVIEHVLPIADAAFAKEYWARLRFLFESLVLFLSLHFSEIAERQGFVHPVWGRIKPGEPGCRRKRFHRCAMHVFVSHHIEIQVWGVYPTTNMAAPGQQALT